MSAYVPVPDALRLAFQAPQNVTYARAALRIAFGHQDATNGSRSSRVAAGEELDTMVALAVQHHPAAPRH